MKKILFLLTSLIMPITVFAATEIGLDDLALARSYGGDPTSKGITYYYSSGFSPDCYSLSDGEYILTEDIILENTVEHEKGEQYFCLTDSVVTIDLNGHKLTSDHDHGPIQGFNTNLTIKGDGLIVGKTYTGIYLKHSNLNIDGGTVHGFTVESEGERYGKVHIKDGEFTNPVVIGNVDEIIVDGGNFSKNVQFLYFGSVVINNGSFDIDESDGIDAIFGESITINNGTFIGDVAVVTVDINNLEINGGSFIGMGFALVIQEIPMDGFSHSHVSLKGGTYKTYSDDGQGAIAFYGSNDNSSEIIESFVSEGYEYSPDLEVASMEEGLEEGMVLYFTQNEIGIKRVSYELLKGSNQTYTLGSGKTLAFEASIPFSEFTASGSVYVNGKELDSKNYTATEGSTIITLNTDYLDTLKVGEHTIVIATDLGEVETTFKVVEGEKKNPATGDNIMAYISLLSLSTIGLSIAKIRKKKLEY